MDNSAIDQKSFMRDIPSEHADSQWLPDLLHLDTDYNQCLLSHLQEVTV